MAGGDRRAAHLMGKGLSRDLMLRNQYFAAEANWEEIGRLLHEEFLAEVLKAGPFEVSLENAVAKHQLRLRNAIQQQEGIGGSDDEPLCANYSPDLQIRILRLDPSEAPGPLLDMGCGERGDLVFRLHTLGRSDTFGFDRLFETAGLLIQAGWFEVPWPRDTWGTILAHHSFALHANRAHVHGSLKKALTYVRGYMDVLRALRPGGSFRYAPALPFVEDLLPTDEWLIEMASGTGL